MARSQRRIERAKQLVLNIGVQDTGGQSSRLKQAVELYSNKYYVRNLILGTNLYNYPKDIIFDTHNPAEVRNLLDTASLLHIHGKHRYYLKWGVTPKHIPSVIHQHGRFPNEHLQLIRDADKINKSLRIVSTHNLIKWADYDFSRWLPSPINTDFYDGLGVLPHNDGKIRICHCPTSRRLKHTELFISVFDKLKLKHPHIELILGEGKTHDEIIKIKQTCDIGYDQILLWYGNNALEFWAMGIPCIVGMGDHTLRKSIELFGNGNEPWVYATEETLYDVLEKLIVDEDYRRMMGKQGKDHVMKYHSYPVVVKKLELIYEKARNLFESMA